MFFTPPRDAPLEQHARLPDGLRKNADSEWAEINLQGATLDAFLEGPVMTEDGALLVADIPFGRILRLDPSGEWTLVYEYGGWPNGMKLLSDGSVLVADHRLGLVRIEGDFSRHDILASEFEGKPLHGPNDLTITADGSVYLTDQGTSGLQDPFGRVLRYRDGGLDLVMDRIPGPNGIVLSGDGKTLFLAVTRANAIWRIPLGKDGRAVKAGTFIQLSGGIGPDGLALDEESETLIVVHPGLGVWTFDKTGHPIEFFSRFGSEYVTNLVASGDGRYLVTESLTSEILSFRPTGAMERFGD